jgi:adenylyltransferase/sulfurtransferase
LSNLQRQIAHTEAAIGVNKAESAATMLRALNSDIEIVALERRLADDLEGVVAHADVVLDCSDNFATRHAVNRACVRHAKPLVSGAAIRFDGQVTCFDPRRVDSPCYHCLFPDLPGAVDERCALMGVFAPLVGIIGSLQAAQAISLATGVGEPLIGTLLMLEGKAMRWQSVRFRRDPACPVCGRPSVAGSNFQEESEREVERA